VVSLVSGGEAAGVDPTGVAFALGSGIAWPTYLVSAKGLFEKAPPVFVVGVVFSGAALVLSPLLVVSDVSWVLSGRGVAVGLWLALVATALSYVAFSTGLRRTAVAAAATFTLVEPVTATVLGVTVLDEPFLASTVAGVLLVVLGLLVLSVERRVAPPGP
jgi:DME family drug/metabolite transporter